MRTADRRSFVVGAGALALTACGNRNDTRVASPASAKEEHEGDEEVSPAEDLMREHGALNRVLLVYDESARRLVSGTGGPVDVIAGGAHIIRTFIEQYHERLEEDFLFPRFEKANLHAPLVATLRRQHEAGRRLTEVILRDATVTGTKDAPSRQKLADALGLFARMYRPHEAREDTVLFPALPKVIGKKELEELGERFEQKEHELFGKAGFEGVVAEVAKLEQALGIHDLAKFTPPV